jgi:ATP/maltotriose-dependent transcriptional regulator MalT
MDDAWGAAFTLTSLGRLALEDGEYAMARRHYAEGLAARRRLGTHMAMRFPIAVSLISLGEAACCAGDDDEAAALFEEALALSRELGSKPHIAWALHNLGRLALRRGDDGRAAACFGESLRLAQAAGQPQRVAAALAGMAGVLAARSEATRAARLAGAAQAQYEALRLALHPADRRDHAQRAAAVQQALGEEAFAAAQAAGRAMPLDEAVADALTAGEERAEPPAVGQRAATSGGADAGLPDQLTAREAEVLGLIAEGIGNQAIADRLVVSLRTVEHHIARIYRKIGARGRADAVAYALRHGLD